ncbi:serine/threonine-protein kinase PLK4-like [Antedon mediterranea]|uniref:serine/threonine-protein kinase PLK4-like n=1 Tax=Antedon mediterranea TaxID=105859 RepID=UPI003AF63974
MSSPVGEGIEDYQVLNLIGKGGFACVYRARSLTTGLEVAIKMIDKKMMQSSGMVRRVRNEVEIHCQLKHPSILELYSYFEDDNYVYLVLEMCHNGELNRFMKTHNRVFTEDEACHLMNQIVIGLLYLHSHGILHRDLTLANILLTKDLNCKIADFGLATKLNLPSDKHYTMCGTPNYISPEIATRSAHGLESDVWSLGCMLFTFLTGKPPFDTDAVKSTLNKVVLGEYDMPRYLSYDAKDLISNLLKKNPYDRISLSGILDHAFMTRAKYKDHHTSHKQRPAESSLDSGHATMATLTSAMNSAGRVTSRNKPMKAFPTSNLTPVVPEERPILANQKAASMNNNSLGRGEDIWPKHARQTSPLRHRGNSNVSNCSGSSKGVFDFNGKATSPMELGSSSSNSWLAGIKDGKGKLSCNLSYDRQRGNDSDGKSNLSPEFFRGSSRGSPSKMITNPDGRNQWKSSKEDLYSSKEKLTSLSNLCKFDYLDNPRLKRYKFSSSQEQLFRRTGIHDGMGERSISEQELSSLSESRQTQKASLQAESRKEYSSELNLHDKQDFDDCTSKRRHHKEDCFGNNHDRGNDWHMNTNNSQGKNYTDSRSEQKDTRDNSHRSKSGKNNGTEDGNQKIRQSGRDVSKADSKSNNELPPPLNAKRLRPIRQKTRNAMVSVLDTGDVCLEFLKTRANQDRVVEVLQISDNGLQVMLFHPNGSKGVPVTDSPPSADKEQTLKYSYNDLPTKYWKKYQYAVKFVQLVRSKTPKVTLYTKHAKCMLMENGPQPDFEACFYNGAKIQQSVNGIRIIESNGSAYTLHSVGGIQGLGSHMRQLLQHFYDSHEQCQAIETTIASLEKKTDRGPYFPLILCRRPASSDPEKENTKLQKAMKCRSPKSNTSDKVLQSSPSIMAPVTASVCSFDGTVLSTATGKDHNHNYEDKGFNKQSIMSQNNVSKSVFVPNVGWASQMSSGEIWVQYNDGSQIIVKSATTTVKYIDVNGKLSRFGQNDCLPDQVKQKLSQLSTIIQMLVAQK